MQKINILTILIILSLSVIACGETEQSVQDLVAAGDLDAIRAKKKELTAQQNALEEDLALLNDAIATNSENANLPLVTTFKTQVSVFNHFVELQGDVTTKQNVLIYPETAGSLIRVLVEEGQKVKTGQILGIIDDGGLKSQLLQMETQLAFAKTTFERQERLWNQKVGSEIQYLQAKTNYETQSSAVTQMKSQLDKFNIKAPFNGIIDDIIKDQGTIVSPGPGSEIFRIVNLSNMYVDIMVPETYITSVVPGKEAKVFFPVLGESMQSIVKETGNFINPANRSFSVKVPVPNKGGLVKPNLSAKVSINDYTAEEAILIPQSVISENAEGDQYVYVIENVKANKTAVAKRAIVTTGMTKEGQVEVLSGIKAGANIILEGARSVKDGQEVKILND